MQAEERSAVSHSWIRAKQLKSQRNPQRLGMITWSAHTFLYVQYVTCITQKSLKSHYIPASTGKTLAKCIIWPLLLTVQDLMTADSYSGWIAITFRICLE